MKILSNEDVKLLQSPWRVSSASNNWHEGSELVGYWPDGDSYVFKAQRHYLAISRGFIEEVVWASIGPHPNSNVLERTVWYADRLRELGVSFDPKSSVTKLALLYREMHDAITRS